MITLFPHQVEVMKKLENGSILAGGTGSGKTIASLAYFYVYIGHGKLIMDGVGKNARMTKPVDLYIITTPKKRDSEKKEWQRDMAHFGLGEKDSPNHKYKKMNVVIDSWNNIKKYENAKDAFFIFDEQRLVGYGAWTKSFLKITKANKWMLLSATPGDVWLDYLAVFIAHGFYKNKKDFATKHIIYKRFTKFPQIDRYYDTHILEEYKRRLVVPMPFDRHTKQHHITVPVKYDEKIMKTIVDDRWNYITEKPIINITELYFLARKLVNSDISRIKMVENLFKENKRMIIFYNFNYELDILRTLSDTLKVPVREWNGQKHEKIPDTDEWIYLVQYTAGAEGWECIETDVTVFYSQNYSYKTMHQAAGRIDRLNTPYKDLYYYTLMSDAWIDKAIRKSIRKKEAFNSTIHYNTSRGIHGL